MRPIVIIAISVVCSVVAVITVLSFSGVDFSEVDVGESVANIVLFDCAKAWDTMQSSLRITDNGAFQKLSPEERMKIRNFHGNILDEFHKNWCYVNYMEWIDKAEDKNGRLVTISNGKEGLSWQNAIDTEYKYNEKFPDGAYKD